MSIQNIKNRLCLASREVAVTKTCGQRLSLTKRYETFQGKSILTYIVKLSLRGKVSIYINAGFLEGAHSIHFNKIIKFREFMSILMTLKCNKVTAISSLLKKKPIAILKMLSQITFFVF